METSGIKGRLSASLVLACLLVPAALPVGAADHTHDPLPERAQGSAAGDGWHSIAFTLAPREELQLGFRIWNVTRDPAALSFGIRIYDSSGSFWASYDLARYEARDGRTRYMTGLGLTSHVGDVSGYVNATDFPEFLEGAVRFRNPEGWAVDLVAVTWAEGDVATREWYASSGADIPVASTRVGTGTIAIDHRGFEHRTTPAEERDGAERMLGVSEDSYRLELDVERGLFGDYMASARDYACVSLTAFPSCVPVFTPVWPWHPSGRVTHSDGSNRGWFDGSPPGRYTFEYRDEDLAPACAADVACVIEDGTEFGPLVMGADATLAGFD